MNNKPENLEKINSLKSKLESKQPLESEVKNRLDRKFNLEFNYNSNHIEGNTLTYHQTELLLYSDISSGDLRFKDVEEMKAHDLALSQVNLLATRKEEPLTEKFIKELNRILLVRPFIKPSIGPDGIETNITIKPGEYKTKPNGVKMRNGEIRNYISPEETAMRMGDLLNWFKTNRDQLHPIELGALFHHKFLEIHPFDDGNGRVARLIMNYVFYSSGFPPVIIKSSDKENYLVALRKSDSGDDDSIVNYVAKEMMWSLNLCLKASDGKNINEKGDLDKEIEVLRRNKLSSPIIHRTPKIIFETFTQTENEVWTPLTETLKKFDDFFAESSIDIYVDNNLIKEKKFIPGTANWLTNYVGREVPVDRYTIFDIDLEEVDINKVVWIQKLLSLKTSHEKVDIMIKFELEFLDSKYSIRSGELVSKFHDGATNFKFSKDYKYGNSPYHSELDKLSESITSFIIERIKTSN
ncbi:Fic family protein [bacterium SCSIO 12741]|nr:Fic family protein [bacterium SCSIO 12741]